MAVGDANGGYGAVAVEVDVVCVERGKPCVGLDAVKGAVDARWDGAGYFEVQDGALEAGGGVHSREDGCWGEGCCCARDGELAVFVGRGGGERGADGGSEVEDVGHFRCFFFVERDGKIISSEVWDTEMKADPWDVVEVVAR